MWANTLSHARPLFGGLMALALAASCAHLKNDEEVCAEHRGMRCVAGPPECDFDRERGCFVCQCPPLLH